MTVIKWTKELQKELDFLNKVIASDGDTCPVCKKGKVSQYASVTFKDDLWIGCCEPCFEILCEHTRREWDYKITKRWIEKHHPKIENAWKEYHLHLRLYNVTHRGVIIGDN